MKKHTLFTLIGGAVLLFITQSATSTVFINYIVLQSISTLIGYEFDSGKGMFIPNINTPGLIFLYIIYCLVAFLFFFPLRRYFKKMN